LRRLRGERDGCALQEEAGRGAKNELDGNSPSSAARRSSSQFLDQPIVKPLLTIFKFRAKNRLRHYNVSYKQYRNRMARRRRLA